jgi:hypothetical protein
MIGRPRGNELVSRWDAVALDTDGGDAERKVKMKRPSDDLRKETMRSHRKMQRETNRKGDHFGQHLIDT